MSRSFDPYHVWLGIPPGKRPPTYYDLLGISAGERDQEVIQTAVLRLSAYVRNFQMGKQADDATRILNELAEAKACLFDPAKRARYDASLVSPRFSTPSARPAPSYPSQTQVAAGQRVPDAETSPLIELGELTVAEHASAAARPMVRPHRSLRPPKRPAPTSATWVWLVPLAVVVAGFVVVAGLAMTVRGPSGPLVLHGQVVPTTPAPPVPTQPIVSVKSTDTSTSTPTSSAPEPPSVVGDLRPKAIPVPEPSSEVEPLPADQSQVSPGGAASAPSSMNATIPAVSAVPRAAFAMPTQRKAVPTGPALTYARSQVDSAYSKEFRTAKTAEQRTAVLHKLYGESQLAKEAALQYAFLEEYRDRAVNMGEGAQACQAIEAMGRLFEVDVWPLKLEALKSSLEKARQSQQAFTVAMLAQSMRDRATATDAATADRFMTLATAARRKAANQLLSLDTGGQTDRRKAANQMLSLDIGGRPVGRRVGGLGLGVLPGIGIPRPGLAASLFEGADFEQELVRRVDRDVDFHFGPGSPDPALPDDRFSIRWTGWLTPPFSGKYIISARADDGVRVKIGSETLIDSWQRAFGFDKHSKEIELARQSYEIVVEFSDRFGPAQVSLRWAIKDLSTEHIIPAEAFSHEPMIGEP